MKALLLVFAVLFVFVALCRGQTDPNDYAEVRRLFGAGSSRYGQLGQFDSTLFTQVPFDFEVLKFCIVNHLPSSDIESVSTTNYEPLEYHAIAISTDLNIYSWGFGSPGQGSPDRLVSTVHEKVPQLLGNINDFTEGVISTGVKFLTCGSTQTFIMTNDAKMIVFGSHERGQLGIGNNATEIAASVITPRRSPSLEAFNFESMWALGAGTFAVSAEKSYAFGDNSFSQLSFANTAGESTYYYVPTEILGSLASGDRLLKSISGGSQYTIMLTTSGKIYACGLDQGGLNLGIGQTSTNSHPATLVYSTTQVKFVASQGQSTVFLDSANVLRGWGANLYNQLCIADTQLNAPVEIDDLTPLGIENAKVNAIKLSSQHTMIQFDDKVFKVCGNNRFGNLGVLDPITNYPPTYLNVSQWMIIEDFKQSTTVTTLSDLQVIDSNVFALNSANGQVFGYGDVSRIPNVLVNFPSMVEIKHNNGSTLFESIATGEFASAAIEKDTGKLFMWGGQRFPIAFLTGGLSQTHVYKPQVHPSFAQRNVSAIYMGTTSPSSAPVSTSDETGYSYTTFYALLNDTKILYSWGVNDYYQLGYRYLNSTRVFSQVNFEPLRFRLPTNNTRVHKVCASGRHWVALTYEDDSTSSSSTSSTDPFASRSVFDLTVIGSNKLGTLGIGSDQTLSSAASPLRTQQGIATDCAVGDFHTMFINNNKRASGTGQNSDGRAGFGLLQSSSTFNPASIGSFISKVYAGAKTTFYIATNGTVYASGDNTFGQLGFPVATKTVLFPTAVPNLPAVLKVSSAPNGGAHTLFLTTDGEVYATGRNDVGQLSLGDFVNRFGPEKITLPEGTVGLEVSAGKDHSLILLGARVCPNLCSGRGICDKVLGVCNCGTSSTGDQYVGFDCSLRQCSDPTCSGHGTCDLDRGICRCQARYKGTTCNQLRCLNNCSGSNRGTCLANVGTCSCKSGFTGLDCSISSDASRVVKRATNSLIVMVAISIIVALLC